MFLYTVTQLPPVILSSVTSRYQNQETDVSGMPLTKLQTLFTLSPDRNPLILPLYNGTPFTFQI